MNRLTKTVIERVFQETGRAYPIDSVEIDLVRLLAITNFEIIKEFTRLEAQAAIEPQVTQIRGILVDIRQAAIDIKGAHSELLRSIKEHDGDMRQNAVDINVSVEKTLGVISEAQHMADVSLAAMGAVGKTYRDELSRKFPELKLIETPIERAGK